MKSHKKRTHTFIIPSSDKGQATKALYETGEGCELSVDFQGATPSRSVAQWSTRPITD